MNSNNGSWIFISHSSSDIETVRLIRNEFETLGQNPLAFHLKCLNDSTQTGKDELENLIKREIAARDWFVYCESAAAERSLYVKMEREYVAQLNKTMIWRIDLSQPLNSILNAVRIICADIHIFCSYSHTDASLVNPLINAFIKKDYGVFTNDNCIQVGTHWESSIKKNIAKTAEYGFFLLILTRNSMNNQLIEEELKYARKKNATIVVFIFDEVITRKEAETKYSTNFAYNIPCRPHDNDMGLLVDFFSNILRWKIDRKHFKITAAMSDAINTLQEKLNYAKCCHQSDPICIRTLGAGEDYCEVYQFPCCGKIAVAGNGLPSKERCDGCIKMHSS